MDIVNQPDHRAVNLWLAHGVPQPVFTVQTVPMEHLAQGPAAVRARAHHEREQKRRGYHPHDEGRYIQPPLVRSITEPVATRHRTVHIDLGGWPACPPTEGIRRVSVLLHPTAGAPLGVSAQPSDESGRRYTVALPEDPASVAWLPAGAYRAQVLVWVHGERQPRVWAQTHNPKNGGETPLTVHLEDEPRRPQPDNRVAWA